MDRDKTCQLSFAGDMVRMLVNGLLERPEVQNVEGAVALGLRTGTHKESSGIKALIKGCHSPYASLTWIS
jgi:hypothetical protein